MRVSIETKFCKFNGGWSCEIRDVQTQHIVGLTNHYSTEKVANMHARKICQNRGWTIQANALFDKDSE